MTPISRRGVLGLLGGLASLLSGLGLAARPLDPVVLHAEALAGVLRDRAGAAVVGRAYLGTAPGEADLARLVELVDPGALAGDLGRAIGERVRADFAAERMARVQGWMLAESEARLFAICALLEDPAVG